MNRWESQLTKQINAQNAKIEARQRLEQSILLAEVESELAQIRKQREKEQKIYEYTFLSDEAFSKLISVDNFRRSIFNH